MNTEIISNIIINEILPNNNRYIKDNIICYLEGNDILIEYKNITYKLKLNKNNTLSLYREKLLIKVYETKISFDEIVKYIKTYTN